MVVHNVCRCSATYIYSDTKVGAQTQAMIMVALSSAVG